MTQNAKFVLLVGVVVVGLVVLLAMQYLTYKAVTLPRPEVPPAVIASPSAAPIVTSSPSATPKGSSKGKSGV